ncbi:MAG: hypothetical protein H6706_23645 [Myxococcales bacterium]|nr:hypothetical protein [Myxococcales bacterium]
MSTRRLLTGGLCLAALFFGCDPESPSDGPDAGERIDGGGGGAGGVGGGGGEGGMGGAGGDPQGPCDQLGEATCEARADCVAQRDVFDAFARCRDVGDAACSLLDEGQCGDRADCAWDGERCSAPILTCQEREAEDDCTAAGCYWYDAACHAERPPAQCDQPEPAACEAAGCQWTDDGCLPQCDGLGRPSCDSRRDCRWAGDHCEMGPAGMACGELGPQDCVGRADCTWDGDGCVDRPDGPCADLSEAACVVRPDCAPVYADDGADELPGGAGGAAGGAGEAPPLPEAPYVGCEDRVFDCANVPVEACERTPGCAVINGACAAEDPDGCGQLLPRQCAQNPRCQLTEVEVCDWDGDGIPDDQFPGDGDGDFLPPDPGQPPCEIVATCEPRPDAPPACRDLPIDQCGLRADCQLEPDPECGGAGGGAGVPAPDPDCEDCLIAPACVICAPRPIQGDCWNLDIDACADRDDCRWVPGGGGGGMDPVPVPPPCGCPPDDPGCGCAEPAPVPPPADGFCQPAAPQGCWDLGEGDCLNHPECEWIGDGGGDVCFCDENGCVCQPGGPGGGFCQERQQPDPCAGLDQGACMADADQCAWVDPEPVPCDCPPGEDCVCADQPGEGGICVFVGPVGRCQAFDPDACWAQDGCEWVDGGEDVCECIIGPDGQEICRCGGGGGFCQPGGVIIPPDGECFDLPEDACGADPACMVLRCEQACLPGDAECLGACAEVEGMCFPRAFLCPEAPIDICPRLDGCQVIDPCPVDPANPDAPVCDAEPFCGPA